MHDVAHIAYHHNWWCGTMEYLATKTEYMEGGIVSREQYDVKGYRGS